MGLGGWEGVDDVAGVDVDSGVASVLCLHRMGTFRLWGQSRNQAPRLGVMQWKAIRPDGIRKELTFGGGRLLLVCMLTCSFHSSPQQSINQSLYLQQSINQSFFISIKSCHLIQGYKNQVSRLNRRR